MSAKQQLMKMQCIQQEHDNYFHADIVSLPVQRRISHMTLHFIKYAGKLMVAKQQGNRDLLKATLIDAFIICLATGNILNKRLSELGSLTGVNDRKTLAEFAGDLAGPLAMAKEDVFAYASDRLSSESGKMAKAVEALDHLESFCYKESLLEGLSNIVEATMVCCEVLGIDIPGGVTARLDQVERKSIFYPLYRAASQEHTGVC